MRIGVAGRIEQGAPLALREAVFTVDRDVDLNVKGLPACRDDEPHLTGRARFALRQIERRCRRSIIGRGRVGISIAFPEMEPIPASSRVVLLYSGIRAGAVLLYALTEIDIPVPAVIATSVYLRRTPGGTWTARAKVPAIAGGSGAITRFSLWAGKRFAYRGRRQSFLSARCPDGQITVKTPMLLFKNEAQIPGASAQTVLRGSLAIPCKPKG